MKTDINIVLSFVKRERGVKCPLRHDIKSVASLVTCKNARFVKVWEESSYKSIHYDSGRLYFNNYTKCYAISGYGGMPSILYLLPEVDVSQKIEEAVVSCQGQVDIAAVPNTHDGKMPSFLALTANQWLIRYHVDTGQLQQKVFLSTRYKFKQISSIDGYSVILRSTKSCSTRRGQQSKPNVLMALAIFTIYPLEFVGMIEITRNIFGENITNAMLSQGILIVMHTNNMVKMYSWEYVLQIGRTRTVHLYETGEDDEEVGSFSTGIPLNIKLKECPPVLFQVKCADCDLTMGGFPWHYIITPPGARSYFRVYSMENEQLLNGGCLDLDSMSIELDRCNFHPDESGRIIHVGTKVAHVYNILENTHYTKGLPTHRVQNIFTISPFEDKITRGPEVLRYSSSGRIIKASYSQDFIEESYECLATVDYEDDMDLLYLNVVHQGPEHMEGQIHIHDNHSGKHLKTVTLEEPWEVFGHHMVVLDMDRLIHIVQMPERKSICYVYRREMSD